MNPNAIQNYSFDKVDCVSDIMADEKDSGISQVSAEPGLEEKFASLDLGEKVTSNGVRLSGTNGRLSGTTRPPAAMDDMLYGNNLENIARGRG